MSSQLIAILILSVIGIANTSYLVYTKRKNRSVLCLFFPDAWCEKVQKSKYSKTFGIPNAYMGLGMYIALFICTLLYAQAMIPLLPLQVIIWVGFLFSMYFLGIQAFVLRAFCTWCVLSAVEFIILLLLLFQL